MTKENSHINVETTNVCLTQTDEQCVLEWEGTYCESVDEDDDDSDFDLTSILDKALGDMENELIEKGHLKQ